MLKCRLSLFEKNPIRPRTGNKQFFEVALMNEFALRRWNNYLQELLFQFFTNFLNIFRF